MKQTGILQFINRSKQKTTLDLTSPVKENGPSTPQKSEKVVSPQKPSAKKVEVNSLSKSTSLKRESAKAR